MSVYDMSVGAFYGKGIENAVAYFFSCAQGEEVALRLLACFLVVDEIALEG